MGWSEIAENGRKIKKLPVTHGGRGRRFAGPISARPAAIDSEIFTAKIVWWWRSSLSGACTVVVAEIGSHG